MYKTGFDRNQLVLFPTYIDELISLDSPVRFIDAFVDSLDLSNFKFFSTSKKGNKPYNPADLLKLFLFGYQQGIRSSRKLMYQANNNIEYIWLVKGIHPDFRTISDFRKDNIKNLKSVMIDFNLACKQLNIIGNFFSQDGTKVKAVNSKDNNFTLSKIDDRKKRILNHIEQYLSILELTDKVDDKEDYLSEIQKLNDRLELLDSYETEIIDNNDTQKSLTDPESKLMRDNGKFTVAYNNQVCVDVDSHIVTDFLVTDKPADLGSLSNISSNIKKTYNFDYVTNVTDKGYNDRNDMMNCLENGIIPEVTPLNNDVFNLETIYEENDINENIINSTNSDDLKKCLRAGVIPNIYKDNIIDIEVKDTKVFIDDDNVINDTMNDDELRDFAIKNNCFTRNIKENKVYCPMGEILRKKSNNLNNSRYCNKLACKNCKNPCCNSSYKIVSFSPNQTIANLKQNISNKKRKQRKKKIVKKVFIKFKVNKEHLKIRMATSEHIHASMKFWDHSGYLLLKGKEKATGELALYYCAFNIKRAIKKLGITKLIEYFNKIKQEKIADSQEKLSYFFISQYFLVFI